MRSIRLEAVWQHPAERIWRALTDPRALSTWLMGTNMPSAPAVGGSFEFRTQPAPGFDGVIRCTFVEVNPPRRLVYTWKTGRSRAQPTTVAWTLTPVVGGTRVLLEHTGFAGFGGLVARTMMRGGWTKKVTNYLGIVLERLAVAGDDPERMDQSSVMECAPVD